MWPRWHGDIGTDPTVPPARWWSLHVVTRRAAHLLSCLMRSRNTIWGRSGQATRHLIRAWAALAASAAEPQRPREHRPRPAGRPRRPGLDGPRRRTVRKEKARRATRYGE